MFKSQKYSFDRVALHREIVNACCRAAVSSSNAEKILIFIAAPVAAGKSTFVKSLKSLGILPESLLQIASETYQLLPQYKAKLPQRHPELMPELYQEHCHIRNLIFQEAYKRECNIMIEMHLSADELKEMQNIAAQARQEGYVTLFMGITMQPAKFFSNARKVVDAGETLDIRQALAEQKCFFGFWVSIQGVNFKLLIDFNAEMDKGEQPFLAALQADSDDLPIVFDSHAWNLAIKTAAINADTVNAEQAYDADGSFPPTAKIEIPYKLADSVNLSAVSSKMIQKLLGHLAKKVLASGVGQSQFGQTAERVTGADGVRDALNCRY